MAITGVIVIGDTTSHGGKVITGDQTWTVDGIPVARVGDQVWCPQCDKMTTIVSSSFPTLITRNGQPVAYDKDITSCGAVLYSRHNNHVGWGNKKADGKDVALADRSEQFATRQKPGMMYASLTEVQETECIHLLKDIQREEETIRKIDKAIKDFKKGQKLDKDYGITIDATPEGYRSKGYANSSNGYKTAVDELESNTTIDDRLSRFDIRDWIPFGNEERIRKKWLTKEKERSVFVLNKMKQIHNRDCKQGVKI